MFAATDLFQGDVSLSYPNADFQVSGAVDHPSTWLELLEVLPCVDSTGQCVEVELSVSERVAVHVLELDTPVLNAGALTGSRRVKLQLKDTAEAHSADIELRVTASADHMELAAVLISAEPELLANPFFAGVLGIAMAKVLTVAATDVIPSIHGALSADLAETAIRFAVVMPSADFRNILQLSRDELGYLEDDAKECGLGYTFTCEARLGDLESTEPAAGSADAAVKRIQLSAQQRLALAINLCELREARGLKQLQVAHQALGFEKSHAAVSRLERGILFEVDAERLEKLATFFGTTVDALLVNKLVSAEPTAPEDATGPSVFSGNCDFNPIPGFGRRLLLARTSAGLSQRALGIALGHMDGTMIRAWEEEQMAPRRTSFIDVAYALSTPVSWLMFGRRLGTPDRGLALRLMATQKLYGLSNTEVAALMGSSSEEELFADSRLVARANRGRVPPGVENLQRLAHALQVPADWLSPPDEQTLQLRERVAQTDAVLSQEAGKLSALSKPARKLIMDIIDLIDMGVITDKDIKGLHVDMVTRFTSVVIRPERKKTRAAAGA